MVVSGQSCSRLESVVESEDEFLGDVRAGICHVIFCVTVSRTRIFAFALLGRHPSPEHRVVVGKRVSWIKCLPSYLLLSDQGAR